MATRERKGASGKIQLSYSFFETASGHEESTKEVTLEGDDQHLILTDSQDSLKVFKSKPRRESVEAWKISVPEFIDWAKKNGKKI